MSAKVRTFSPSTVPSACAASLRRPGSLSESRLSASALVSASPRHGEAQRRHGLVEEAHPGGAARDLLLVQETLHLVGELEGTMRPRTSRTQGA